ncbi:MAG: type I-C CRISPR-associated protein Cas8c/Csd1, partial [Myxococcaceae bacterium]
MMLTALYEYAKREGLLEDTDYEPRRIDLVIKLKRDGSYLGLVPTPEKGLVLRVPRLETRTVAIAPGFLVDNAKYVLGLAGADAKDKDRERAARCNAAFQELITSALASEKSDETAAVASFERALESNLKHILEDRPQEQWTGSENLAFDVDGSWAHESQGARNAWAAMRAQSSSSLAAVRCLVTGGVRPPELKHPPIKRMPGTQQAQTMLVSFNAPAFTSMHFEQAQNAPVSREGAEGYVT